MKTMEVLTRLWDSTCYHVLAQPGRNEAKLLRDMLQKTLEIFSVFHHSLEVHLGKVQAQALNIPVMQNFRDELLQSRSTVSSFLQEEARRIGNIVHKQAEYMFLLDTSQQEAKKQFTIHTYECLAQGLHSSRKLKSLLDYSRAASYEENARVSVFGKSEFERWCAEYSVRTHQFFLKIYSTKWTENSRNFAYSMQGQPLQSTRMLNQRKTANHQNQMENEGNSIEVQCQNHENSSVRNAYAPFTTNDCLKFSHKDVFIDEEYLEGNQTAGEKDLIQEIFNEIELQNMTR